MSLVRVNWWHCLHYEVTMTATFCIGEKMALIIKNGYLLHINI